MASTQPGRGEGGPLLLITGITGFLATHVLDAALAAPPSGAAAGAGAPLRVRGTLRSLAAKGEAVLARLPAEQRERVELVEVEDTATSDLSRALRGVTMVAHVASPYQLDVQDAERDLLKPAIEGTLNLLRHAAREPSVQRVAITSSFAAVTNFQKGGPNRPGFVYTAEDWNPLTYEDAVSHGGAGAVAYSASKKLAEKAAWDFMEKEKPHFSLATFCPPMIYGPTLQPGVKRSNLNTSSKTIYNLISNADKVPDDRLPLFCAARDVADAHVAYLLLPSATAPTSHDGPPRQRGQRFLLCSADAYNWGNALAYLSRVHPELRPRFPRGWQDAVARAKDPKTSYARLDTRAAQEELGVRFRGWEETLEECVQDLLRLESRPGWDA